MRITANYFKITLMFFLSSQAEIAKDWEPKFTLETIVICGEYCRLYKFDNLEEKCWKLSHKLATALQDSATCTYGN